MAEAGAGVGGGAPGRFQKRGSALSKAEATFLPEAPTPRASKGENGFEPNARGRANSRKACLTPAPPESCAAGGFSSRRTRHRCMVVVRLSPGRHRVPSPRVCSSVCPYQAVKASCETVVWGAGSGGGGVEVTSLSVGVSRASRLTLPLPLLPGGMWTQCGPLPPTSGGKQVGRDLGGRGPDLRSHAAAH